MRFQALILLACCGLPGLDASARPCQKPDVAELVAKALSQDDDIDPRILESIGLTRSPMALNGLRDCCERSRIDLRPHALRALRHFQGVSGLERPAIKFLAESALSGSAWISQPATRTLALFGDAARRELMQVLEQSEDRRTLQFAVGGLLSHLAAQGTPEALELLLEHFLPWNSGSAELGASALASFGDPASTKVLHKALAHSKTPASLRTILVQALVERPGASNTAALEKALRDKDGFVVAAAIEGLRRRGDTGHVRSLSRLTRHASASVRFEAFYSLALLEGNSPDFERKLARALEGKDFALRMAAAAAMGAATDAQSGERLAQLIDDANPSVQLEAIERAKQRRVRSAIPQLINRLGQGGARLQDSAHSALVELTAMDHGPGPERWSAWWNGEQATFQLPTRDVALSTLQEREERGGEPRTQAHATFYDVRFASDRVVFVLDVSGSMAIDGRMQRMQQEMLSSLEQIPDGSRFDVILFHTKVIPWGKQLHTMNPKTRLNAQAYIKRLRPLENTNLHAGLHAAFAHADVDTIVLLSDGEPSVGVKQTEEILADVRQWNDLRGVTVHCVALGWNGELLEALADQSQGTFVAAR